MSVTLIVVEPRTKSQAWYRTADGRFDVLGDDLNCTGAAARAAGAGPVWSWRPAKPTRYTTDYDEHHFCSKANCLADLELHAGPITVGIAVVRQCVCGQKNRVIVGTRSRCGRCRREFAPLAMPGGRP